MDQKNIRDDIEFFRFANTLVYVSILLVVANMWLNSRSINAVTSVIIFVVAVFHVARFVKSKAWYSLFLGALWFAWATIFLLETLR